MASAFFERKYRGRRLEDWNGNHEALKSKFKIDGNTLATEFSACERFGLDPIEHLKRPRDERKAVVGYHMGQNMIDVMYAFDSRPKTKPKSGKKSNR